MSKGEPDVLIGGVEWGLLSSEEIDKLEPEHAGQLADGLWSGMKRAGIRRGPSRPWGPDRQAVEDVLFALRAQASRQD